MTILKNIGLLIARILLAVVLIAHGWDKFSNLSTYQEGFSDMGVPVPSLSAILAAAVELGGGALLLLGLLTPIAGILVFLVMLGAFFFAHFGTTVMVAEGGFELVAAIGAGALALAAAGAGAISIDAAIGAARRSAEPAEASASA